MKLSFNLYRTKERRQMLNSNDRLHYQQKAKITKNLRNLAYVQATSRISDFYNSHKEDFKQFGKNNTCEVIVTVYSPTRRRLDPPNCYPTVKALIDGMTDAGVWTDDNHEVIKAMTFQYGGLSYGGFYTIEIEVTNASNAW